jgi:hypothetical protein
MAWRRSSSPLRLPLLLFLLFFLAASSAPPAPAPAAASPAPPACAAFVPGPLLPSPSIRAWAGATGLAAKRDKKSKPSSSRRRPGKSSSSEEEGEEGGASEEGEAPRVSSQINIPVRRQIAFVKQMKKLMQQDDRPATPPPKKARKKKTGAQRAAIASDYPAFDPSLCTTYLLVDGYNVIKCALFDFVGDGLDPVWTQRVSCLVEKTPDQPPSNPRRSH